MKKILCILIVAFISVTTLRSQFRNDDFLPIGIGNQSTYTYSTSDWDQLQDIISSDSGSAVCSVMSTYGNADSTIWGFRETRDIVHHVNHYFPPQYDTSYSIIDTTLFSVIEHLDGNHLLIRMGSLKWNSVFPITREFADSATFFRYSSAISDTFTLKGQYPKSVNRPYFILIASFKRLIGLTRISYSTAYVTGVVLVSNHVLKSAIVSSIEQRGANPIPNYFELSQNFPNPFNPVTVIPFSLAKATKATIRIYDLLGRCVETIFDTVVQPGNYRAIWNAAEQSSGTYVCVLRANGISKAIKLVLLK
jgi:hypothetical protein